MPTRWAAQTKTKTVSYTTTKDTHITTIREQGIQSMAAAVALPEFMNGTDVKLLINVDLLNWLIIKMKPRHHLLYWNSFNGYKK